MGRIIVVILIIVGVAGYLHDQRERKRIEEANRQKEEIGTAILGGVISAIAESATDNGTGLRQQIGDQKAPRKDTYNPPVKDGVNHYDANGNYIGTSRDSYRGVQP